jgi:glycosyltransferase involved in cell wall biosynthesis
VLISVIVPYFNSEEFFPGLISSFVRSLEACPAAKSKIEFIFIDNASTDNGRQILKQALGFAGSLNVVFSHEKRKGVSHARNRGLDCAQGDVLAFVDSDDTVEPDYFTSILQFATSGENLLYMSNLGYAEDQADGLIGRDELVRNYIKMWPTWLWCVKRHYLGKLRFIGECYEDVILFSQLLDGVEHLQVIHKKIYNYSDNFNSITRAAKAEWLDQQFGAAWTILAKKLKRDGIVRQSVYSSYVGHKVAFRRMQGDRIIILGPRETFEYTKDAKPLRTGIGMSLLAINLGAIPRRLRRLRRRGHT